MLIRIPFIIHFKYLMLSGIKVCTSRPRQMGRVGDHFFAFGHRFVITEVQLMTLDFVANGLYKEEGTSNPDEFISIWRTIHPMKGYNPYAVVYTHWFKEVSI